MKTILILIATTLMLSGCLDDGSNGANGQPGPQGVPGIAGVAGPAGAQGEPGIAGLNADNRELVARLESLEAELAARPVYDPNAPVCSTHSVSLGARLLNSDGVLTDVYVTNLERVDRRLYVVHTFDTRSHDTQAIPFTVGREWRVMTSDRYSATCTVTVTQPPSCGTEEECAPAEAESKGNQ